MAKSEVQSKLIIIFYRNPVLGHVKSRLARRIGDLKALQIYEQLCDYTRDITLTSDYDKVVCYDQKVEVRDRWDDDLFLKQPQFGNDLGQRMQNAFEWGFTKGYRQILIIGTDCPELTESIVQSAFGQLQNHDVVIGPAVDGGYYLLGIKSNTPELFREINWGSNQVYAQTMNCIAGMNLSAYVLPQLRDIDRPEDLEFFNLSTLK